MGIMKRVVLLLSAIILALTVTFKNVCLSPVFLHDKKAYTQQPIENFELKPYSKHDKQALNVSGLVYPSISRMKASVSLSNDLEHVKLDFKAEMP